MKKQEREKKGAGAMAPVQSKPAAGAPAEAAGGKQVAPAAPLSAEKQEMAAALKEMEGAMHEIRFFPVAVDRARKDAALSRLESIYRKGNDTVRQMLLYMAHESLATSMELKAMHTPDFFRAKNPGQDASQLRISVYRAMFNYNTSIEGLAEIVRLLGRLGGDDSAKLLTYHFSHLAAMENEANHMLRSAILGALGESDSLYALHALLEYARYTDSERTFNRVVGALTDWEDKLEDIRMPPKEKKEIRERLKEIVAREFGASHYG